MQSFQKPYIVGITGGSASGKTKFLSQIMDIFENKHVCLISQDNYYIPRDQQPVDENGVSNFDLPQSIDGEAFARDILQLKNGKKVIRKEYTFNNPKITPKTLEFVPEQVIIVEGIFVLYFTKVAKLLDLKVFIDAKEHIKLKRRIIRDNSERGYDLDDVLYRYEKHVHPTYEKFIEPFKNDADIVIPNNTNFDIGLKVLVDHLKPKLSNSMKR